MKFLVCQSLLHSGTSMLCQRFIIWQETLKYKTLEKERRKTIERDSFSFIFAHFKKVIF